MRIKERLVIVEQVATDLVVANFVGQPVPEGKTEPVAREDDDRGLLPAQLADEVLLFFVIARGRLDDEPLAKIDMSGPKDRSLPVKIDFVLQLLLRGTVEEWRLSQGW